MDNVEVVLQSLNEYLNYYKYVEDPRQYAFTHAIITIENTENAIDKILNDEKLPYIGSSISSIIKDICYGAIPESLYDIRSEYSKILNDKSSNPHKHYLHRDYITTEINELLSGFKMMDKYYITGSYRRMETYCGDADLLLVSEMPELISIEFIDYVSNLYDDFGTNYYSILSKGPSKCTLINNASKFQIDVRFCTSINEGSFLLHMTGSKDFNVRMRRIALSKGFSLSEYGLKDKSSNYLHEFKCEEDVFKMLGMEYVPPNKR